MKSRGLRKEMQRASSTQGAASTKPPKTAMEASPPHMTLASNLGSAIGIKGPTGEPPTKADNGRRP